MRKGNMSMRIYRKLILPMAVVAFELQSKVQRKQNMYLSVFPTEADNINKQTTDMKT